MGKKSRTKRPGRYCWACDSYRSNESFSGRGHARHLCRECARLPAAELAHRSALNNLGRCITWEGIIPRKRRRQFLTFLEHADPRIRQIAMEMQRDDLIARGQFSEYDIEDEMDILNENVDIDEINEIFDSGRFDDDDDVPF